MQTDHFTSGAHASKRAPIGEAGLFPLPGLSDFPGKSGVTDADRREFRLLLVLLPALALVTSLAAAIIASLLTGVPA